MENHKPDILLLTTGGTIASLQGDDGLAPSVAGTQLADRITPVIGDCRVTVQDLFQLDSSNIQPEQWQQIARAVFDAIGQYDGVVITHGTDTMAYTASALSFALQNLPIPVILTGSQLPLGHPLSDGWENLRDAFAMAQSGTPGVFVCFHRKMMRGCRAVKVRTTAFNAFESVGLPNVGEVDGRGLLINQALVRRPNGTPAIRDQFSDRVILIKLTPGFDPAIFDTLLTMDYRGIVIEAFGLGGLQFIGRDLTGKLQKAVESGISVVACSQCLYETSDFTVYEAGQKALQQGVIEGRDMTSEAAVTKLMWALGQTDNPKEVRKLFATDIAGEILFDN